MHPFIVLSLSDAHLQYFSEPLARCMHPFFIVLSLSTVNTCTLAHLLIERKYKFIESFKVMVLFGAEYIYACALEISTQTFQPVK